MGIKAIYTAIEAQLKTINGSDSTPLFKHYHTWNNQFLDLLGDKNNDISIPFPAVFIEINIDNIEQMGNQCQLFDCTLKLHIAHQLMDSGGGEFEQNWAVFDVVDTVYLVDKTITDDMDEYEIAEINDKIFSDLPKQYVNLRT